MAHQPQLPERHSRRELGKAIQPPPGGTLDGLPVLGDKLVRGRGPMTLDQRCLRMRNRPMAVDGGEIELDVAAGMHLVFSVILGSALVNS
ncbi:hypothetical protein [Massilia sp. Root418]|uniref:hypothetical protein n=1 Tax=Massilia sp. Root418 TaxID=1736532 RepID=UPI0012F6E273|nr:hypothetical protein [Massilia sp. Root418]